MWLLYLPVPPILVYVSKILLFPRCDFLHPFLYKLFPITITICKQWSKFVTCSPSSGALGDWIVPKDIVIGFFDYAEQIAILKFWSGDFGKKLVWEGVSRSQRHSYWVFWLCWTQWLSQNFNPLTLGKKWAWEEV